MKSKYLFLAAALPLAFTACQNDEFTHETGIGQDKLGTLIESPLLGVGVEMGDASTRVYEEGSWKWKPTVGAESPYAKVVEAIGLCWTGVNNGDGYKGPADNTGDMVYTNVKFNHVGWLYEGEEAPKLHCGNLSNGEFHDFDGGLNPQAAWDTEKSFYKANASEKTLDFAKGMFKSDNGTIYEGEYIVYFPYNDSFWNAPVTAKQERLLDLTVAKDGTIDSYELMSKYAFNVGYKDKIAGGKEACQFSTRILTSGIKFNLSAGEDTQIKEIVLWSKGEKGFLTSQALSAQKIKEALIAGSLSTSVYMDAANNDASSTMVVRTEKLKVNEETAFYVPFLPNTFKDLNILLVKDDGKVAVLDQWDNIKFEANAPKTLNLHIDGDEVKKGQGGETIGTFVDKNFAYDQTSFEAAYAKALDAASSATPEPRTVVMLDNIKLEKTTEKYSTRSDNKVIIESDPSLTDDKKNTLTLAGNASNNITYTFNSTDFDVDIETVAQGCCNGGGVNLILASTDTKKDTKLTVNGGALTLREAVILNGDVFSKFEPKDEEGELHNDRVPSVTVDLKATVEATAQFLNQGEMIVKATTNGKGILNLKGATFINDEDASIKVEGVGQQGKDGVINMSDNATLTNKGDIYNHGNIDNNSSKGSFINKGGATFTDYVGSSLSGHRIENESGAEFICEVNSLVRYNNAIDLQGIRPTTTVRFVYGEQVNIGAGTFTTTYTLEPQEGKDGIYVPYNDTQLVKFESAIDNKTSGSINALTLNHKTDADKKAIATKIGDLTVKSGRITINHEALTIDGDYTAEKGALNTNLPVGIEMITGDMNLSTTVVEGSTGNVTLAQGKTLNIGGDLNANDIAVGLTFNSNSVLKVTGDINIKKVVDGTNFMTGTQVIAKNMTVDANQKVKFDKNNVTYLGKGDTNNGVLTNNGAIDIVNAVTGSDVAAKVWCNKRAGNGTYANNSYPQYY